MRLELGPDLIRSIRLDDDPTLVETPAQLPLVELLQRVDLGRDDAGDRTFDWDALAELLVVAYKERQVVAEDQRKMRLKVVALWDEEEVLDVTDLAIRVTSVAGDEWVYRIGEFDQNGFRLTLTGERNY